MTFPQATFLWVADYYRHCAENDELFEHYLEMQEVDRSRILENALERDPPIREAYAHRGLDSSAIRLEMRKWCV